MRSQWCIKVPRDSFVGSSAYPPTILVPLSESTSNGNCLRFTTLQEALWNAFVSIPYAISKCTARQRRHANKHKYLLVCFFLCPCLVINDPAISSPILVKPHNGSLNLIAARGTMICFASLAFLFFYSLQFFSTS